jgi:hypothetical protein
MPASSTRFFGFQDFLVQTEIGYQVLQPPVLIFQPLQLLRIADVHPSVLRLPGVDRRRAHANLTRQLWHLPTRFVLLQDADDLLFCEPPLLHLRISFPRFFYRADLKILNFIWSKLPRARHFRYKKCTKMFGRFSQVIPSKHHLTVF